eukprot:TCONS_00021230-protein
MSTPNLSGQQAATRTVLQNTSPICNCSMTILKDWMKGCFDEINKKLHLIDQNLTFLNGQVNNQLNHNNQLNSNNQLINNNQLNKNNQVNNNNQLNKNQYDPLK